LLRLSVSSAERSLMQAGLPDRAPCLGRVAASRLPYARRRGEHKLGRDVHVPVHFPRPSAEIYRVARIQGLSVSRASPRCLS